MRNETYITRFTIVVGGRYSQNFNRWKYKSPAMCIRKTRKCAEICGFELSGPVTVWKYNKHTHDYDFVMEG